MDRKNCPYGVFNNYPKIHIYNCVNGVWGYACSTTWARSCKEAQAVYAKEHDMHLENVKCYFAKE